MITNEIEPTEEDMKAADEYANRTGDYIGAMVLLNDLIIIREILKAAKKN